MKTRKEIDSLLDSIQFLSPNEPITKPGIQRILNQLNLCIADLESSIGGMGREITLWNPNMVYAKDDIVLYFKQESRQVDPEVGKREFAFLLISTKDGDNTSIPNYDLVDGVPDFKKSNWKLLNPMSYLLQDIIGMRTAVKEVFEQLLKRHVEEEHGLIGSDDIESNLVKTDFSNLSTAWGIGEYSLNVLETEVKNVLMKKSSNGIMEYAIRYSFDSKANQQIKIEDYRNYYQKSAIWDESDDTIFSQKYMEDDMFSVTVNPELGISFNNLRYGTNIFHSEILFSEPFINDEYMVFFDTYGAGEFVFGYGRTDLMDKTEPTYDAVVSMPMLMNKTKSGFDVVLPMHTHFNSL